MIPAHLTPGVLPGLDETAHRMAIPGEDTDPVSSPENASAAAESGEQRWSSSQAGMRDLLPPDDDTVQPRRGRRKVGPEPPAHQETATEDEHVGQYYLDNGDWKAALSRYESALVLDPDNPDVYWGLAESERGLGQFAEARDNYRKVAIYDPGSRHARKARKYLADPRIANAKPQQVAQAPATQP